MAYLDWNNSMSVGVNEFDEHHKKLISYINDLFDSMQKGKGKEIISSLLKNLHEYSIFHFSKEEEILKSINYPKLNEQIESHKEYVAKIKEFYDKSISNDILLSVDLLDFLSNWLKNHILITDMEYKQYFLNK